METIETFLDSLASERPVPGGGSAAALQLALGAALISMVANLTLGRKRFAQAGPEAESVRLQAEDIRQRALALRLADERAYGAVADAQKLPRGTDEERAHRHEALQRALREAVLPPQMTMRLAGEVVDLAHRLLPVGNPSAVSDVGVAAASARAAYVAAELNVDINLAAIEDEEWVRATRQAGEASANVPARADQVVEAVRLRVSGSP